MNNHPEIVGWGADSDPNDRPAVPKERTPPRDIHPSYATPEQQVPRIPVLVSKEHKGLTPVFGTSTPPRGLSGLMRHFAFRYSEGDLRHWLILLAADRVDVVEGLVDDLVHLRPPNVIKELGWYAELRHRPVRGVLKIGFLSGAIGFLIYKVLTPVPKRSIFQRAFDR